MCNLSQGLIEQGYEQGIEQGIERGFSQGQRKSILEILEDLGSVDSRIKERLDMISDEKELSRLHKLAARATSIEEFEKELG